MNKKLLGCVCSLIAVISACSNNSTENAITRNNEWEIVTVTFSGVEMVQVPAGCFVMGSNNGRRDEHPITEVCFDSPFWIDKYEVTNQHYGSEGPFPGNARPRTNVNWFEARDYCTSRDARLPTEAEWEYAARGPSNYIYPWGNTFEADNLVYDSNADAQTHEVGSRPNGVSWVGAYDMAGNAWEWVSSLYLPYPYDAADGREDMANAAVDRRVYRGGQGSYIDFGTSATKRFRGNPDKHDWFVGFRCAKDD